MKIDVNVGEEFKKYVKEYQERKELATFDEAFGALALVGAKRTQALDKDIEKHKQALRFEAGEIKTAPVFEPRKNRHPELVKPPEKKEPKKEKPAKEPKPAKTEKAPKSTLSNKVKAAKPKAPPAKKAKAVKVVKGEEPKAVEPAPAPKTAPSGYGTEEVAKKWYDEQKAKGVIVKPTDLTRQFGWAYNKAVAFLDEQKVA